MLTVNNIEVVYDGVILVLKGVSLTARPGEITTVLGANGAGKTTTLKAISGLLMAERGQVTKGTIELDGARLDRLPPHEVVRHGVVQVFEGRRVFENLTVEENLVVGGHVRHDHGAARWRQRAYALFPQLRDAAISGPAICRAASSRCCDQPRADVSPKVILLDEPSLGLAPRFVEEICRVILQLKHERQLTIVLVEQNAALALEVADHGYVMENGRVVLEGPAEMLRRNPDVKEFYLGLNDAGTRRSYHDVKRYRRRKRWLS
jgi:branched-chain amino acid transport system ATP-binding protein